MRDGAAFHGDVILRSAKIGGQLDMTRASFAKTLNANNLNVGHDFYMREGASFGGDVDLLGAKIGGQLDMTRASFAKTLNADKLSVGSSLFMRDGAAFNGDVILRGAEIGGQLDMTRASFVKTLNAESLNVGSDLLMYGKATTFGGHVNMRSARAGGNLYLNESTVTQLDLTGAAIAGELNIVDLAWHCTAGAAPMHWELGDPGWRRPKCDRANNTPFLSLRNVKIGALQDSVTAWPPSLDLEGFHYDRLGGLLGTGTNDMRNRSAEQWNDWLARDPTFSPQPYVQLANVLLAAGHRETSDRVQYAGREREQEEAWHRGDWVEGAWLWVLGVIVGYGIGLYTFRVLWWVLGLTVLGAVVLWFSPVARRRGVAWRLGASLHRLLPVVELNKEFQDFFDNPPPAHVYEPRNLNRWQAAFFAGLAIAGWILGIFLIAALGGLMPKGG